MTGLTPDHDATDVGDDVPLYWSIVQTPIGPVRITGDHGRVASLYLDEQRHRPADDPGLIRDDERLSQTAAELEEYFAGRRTVFEVGIDLRTGTDFQHAVWEQLAGIPFGVTVSYGELAARMGSPRASRAVGLANGRNPISIILPCHRVVGSNGSLTGYGGGLERKRWLLEHERQVAQRHAPASNVGHPRHRP